MLFSRYFSVISLIGAVSIGALSACGDDNKPADPAPIAGASGTPSIGVVDNPGTPRAGSGGIAGSAVAGTTAAGTGGVAGAVAGAGGVAGAAAGSGGVGGAAGAAAGSGGAGGASGASGSSGAAGADPNDPFAGLFPADATCDGFLCLEDADCASLYPDDAQTCKFTKCVDFACTP